MPDPTQTALPLISPFQMLLDDPSYSVPTGNELYNKLMQGIEPELMTVNLEGLQEKYKNETDAETDARSERYGKAFAEYDTQLAAYLAGMAQNLQKNQRIANASVEKRDRTFDQDKMSTLESQFFSF